MTGCIRYMQLECEASPDDKKKFVVLKELIDKRKKFLRILRNWDYRRYEWVLETLDLEYKPRPTVNFNVFRRDCMRRLTDEHCDKIRQDRLAQYKEELQSHQVEFLADKIAKLKFIRQEQLDLGIENTVSKEEIARVESQYKELKARREEEAKGKDTSTKWKMF